MAAKKKPVKLLVFLAVVAAGGWYLYHNLGGMITRTAEDIASDALGVKVDIGSIHVSLSDRKATVNKLEIANPPGYTKAHAMTADRIEIGLNTASRELIDFKDITVKGSVVNLEITERGINLNELKRLASRKEQKESAGAKQVRVIVQHMVIDASVINTSITLANRIVPPLKMPAISFAGMGKGGGINADDAITQVLAKYLTAVESTARKEGVMSGLPGLGDVQKTIDDAAGSILKMF